MREAASRPRFGALDEISGSDFVQRVTEASRSYWVVCLLYKASHAGCQVGGWISRGSSDRVCNWEGGWVGAWVCAG